MRKRFLHEFKFPVSILRQAYLQVVRQCIEDSKYAEHTAELMDKLTEITNPVFDRFKENKMPLIAALFRSTHNYCLTIDKHPTLRALENFLLPELVDTLDTCLHSYLIAEESDFEYTPYCSNAVNYRLNRYKSKLPNIIMVYEKI